MKKNRSRNIKVNHFKTGSHTALHIAFDQHHIEIVKFLLSTIVYSCRVSCCHNVVLHKLSKVNTEQTDDSGRIPLYIYINIYSVHVAI